MNTFIRIYINYKFEKLLATYQEFTSDPPVGRNPQFEKRFQ